MAYCVYLFDFTPAVQYLERLMYHTTDQFLEVSLESEIEWQRQEEHDSWMELFRLVFCNGSFIDIKNAVMGMIEAYQGDHVNVTAMLEQTNAGSMYNIAECFITLCFNITKLHGGDLKQVTCIDLLKLEFYNQKVTICLGLTHHMVAF